MGTWTQDEAIAYECAREAITHMRAILNGQLYDENKKEHPDAERVASLRAELTRMFQERSRLQVSDQATIARVRAEYGAHVRAWNAEQTEQHQAVAV
jgi:hypothetical protein